MKSGSEKPGGTDTAAGAATVDFQGARCDQVRRRFRTGDVAARGSAEHARRRERLIPKIACRRNLLNACCFQITEGGMRYGLAFRPSSPRWS